MKYASLLVAMLFPVWAFAQTVNVDKIDSDSTGDTTIHIHKGAPVQGNPVIIANPAPKWEVQDGNADVEGDASATQKDAKAAWTKACKDWKKEIREDNKDNKVLNLNCGSASCGGEAGSKVCSSKATYKIKTRVDQ